MLSNNELASVMGEVFILGLNFKMLSAVLVMSNCTLRFNISAQVVTVTSIKFETALKKSILSLFDKINKSTVSNENVVGMM